MEKRIFDRENRFVDYACRMIDVIESLQTTRAGNYIAGQLIKSCISPAFNYGEVQGSESRNDFIHKMGVVLKELKRMPYSIKNYKKKRDDKTDKETG